ncbi:MAG: hypothetical protein NTW49_02735 [Bacteroidia bacterium]|nr:hypothetical protein [Bacteroidia bacterium]
MKSHKIMRKVLFITSVFLFFGLTCFSQVLTNEQNRKLEKNVDSLLTLYQQYGIFSDDGESLSDNYFENFYKLFKSGSLIFNDISLSREIINDKISPKAYGKIVRKFYPAGLTLSLTGMVKSQPVFKDGNYEMIVTGTKKVNGHHSEKGRLIKTYQVAITVEVSENLDKYMIADISNIELKDIKPGEKVAEKKSETDMQAEKEKAIKKEKIKPKPVEILPVINPMIHQSFISVSLKYGATFLLAPGIFDQSAYTKLYNGAIKESTGSGITVDYSKCFFETRRTAFLYGFGLGYSGMNSKLSMDSLYEEYNMPNPVVTKSTVTATYTRQITGRNLNDKIFFSNLEIPVYLKINFKYDSAFVAYTYISAGALLSYSIKDESSVSGTFDYLGTLYFSNGMQVPLTSDNQEFDIAPGVKANNIKHNLNRNKFSLGGFISCGVAFSLSPKLTLETGANVDMRSVKGSTSETTPYVASKTSGDYVSPVTRTANINIIKACFECKLKYRL